MAPTLRSSAQNTPSGKSATASEQSPVTPRKTPTCSKCKRPRAGHPRSGCPYVDSPSNDGTAHTPPPSAGKSIEDALGSMQLASSTPGRDEDTKAVIRNRRRSSLAAQAAALVHGPSLLSLDSDSQGIVERLLQPGMFDDDAKEDTSGASKATAKVIQWQEALLATPVKPKSARVKMPGSLTTPSPESSQVSVCVEESGKSSAKAAPIVAEDSTAAVDQPLSGATRRPQPLVRSMSAEQREIFLSGLHNSSDATVYVVPRADIHDIHAEAIKLGFHARIVLGKDTNDPQGLIVLGRNETAVKRLYEQVEVERKKSSRLRAAAGGAVVGAVGAFAGLAFS
ncbi:hypothetical protein LshimejAT787_0110650 [Lyophyllum shimeji]|uniref:Uncharacterized protein n=1 Tax=Lyophyllum shimeji TaxID=47721 RepID=A0A9P3UK95_LYOSH|nr:hypothetical protein LshimejAT787_0110650 [Lyophyllum shimeji]